MTEMRALSMADLDEISGGLGISAFRELVFQVGIGMGKPLIDW